MSGYSHKIILFTEENYQGDALVIVYDAKSMGVHSVPCDLNKIPSPTTGKCMAGNIASVKVVRGTWHLTVDRGQIPWLYTEGMETEKFPGELTVFQASVE